MAMVRAPLVATPYPRAVETRPYSHHIHQTSGRLTPQPDSDDAEGKRKRVSVACARCRKRKIKCSGDTGKGGCTNCAHSGLADQCTFLRVNSQPATEVWKWSYGLCPIANIASHSSNGTPSHSMNQALFHQNQYQYARCPNMYGYSGRLSTLGQQNYNGIPSYSDELSEGYNVQSPPYMLPSQDGPNSYGSHEPARWPPLNQNSRPSTTGIYLDQETPNSYTGSSYPIVNTPAIANTPISINTPTSRLTSNSSDSISNFPTMSPLASCLPSSTDRLLPIPSTNRATTSTQNSTQSSTGDVLPASPYASTQGQDFRTDPTWASESISPSTGQSRVTSYPNGSQSSTLAVRPRNPSATCSEATVFGYPMAIPRSPPSTGASASSSFNSTYNASTTQPQSVDFATVADSTTLQDDDFGENYTWEKRPKRGSLEASNKDNQSYSSYTPARAAVHTSSPGLGRRGSYPNRPHSAQRTSIPEVSARRAY
ncbi:MAG: hypothetical protein M1834_007726 [Cirrosporium novae-zelandiae]|nr:MAG: hypothetical protein M1834_007726 [Cirrosporium novae-zelandiae]